MKEEVMRRGLLDSYLMSIVILTKENNLETW